MNVLKKINKESGYEFLERIKPRPRIPLKDLLPYFNLPANPNQDQSGFEREVVEISGDHDNGKTCEHRIILPNKKLIEIKSMASGPWWQTNGRLLHRSKFKLISN